jgi:hypothetical protein
MGNLRKATIVVILGAFIIGAVFSSSLVGCKKDDETMNPENGGFISDNGIPAIDRSVPARTETATFALG